MATVIHPIVQAEFMSWMEGTNLSSIFQGAFSKVTLRIYDDDGELSRTIRRSAASADAYNALVALAGLYPERPYDQKNIIPRIVPAMDEILKIKMDLHQQATRMVAARVKEAVRKERPVAMENPDRTFRPAKASEIQAVAAVMDKVRGAYLFLFPANADLLADSHASVTPSMG